MNRRLVASIGIIGMTITMVEGGFHLGSHNGMTSISLPPLVLSSWVFFLLAAAATEFSEIQQGMTKAPWWRKSLSFIYDFYLFFCLLFIPATFLALVIELGGFPPPWSVIDSVSTNNAFSVMFFLICLFLFWGGMGLALHPRIRTPGMILSNIDLRVEQPVSLPKIAFFGLFGYYGVFIPLFNLFSQGVKASGTMRGV